MQRARAVDLLKAGVLTGGAVGSHPEAVGGTGAAAVEVPSEDDGVTVSRPALEDRPELGALWGVGGDLNRLVGGEVSRAHIDGDPGADT